MLDNINLVVGEQLPEFVRNDYPTFVEFVKAYYKWLSLPAQNVGRIENVIDIDTTPAKFVEYFRYQLDALGMGAQAELAGVEFNTRYLKNIKEFYTSKGSEQALVFLLKNIFNTDSTIRYPNESVLRASDGKWRQDRIFTLNGVFGTLPETFTELWAVNGTTLIRVPFNKVEYPQTGQLRVYHETATKIELDQLFEVIVDGAVVWAGKVIAAPATIEVVNGGEGWQLGQILIWPGTVKNTVARVSKTSASGTILRAEILEFGWVHTANQSITVLPAPDAIVSATLTLKSGVTAKAPGRWMDAAGQVSNQEIVLEDSYYYQQFSYDIETPLNPNVYTNLAQAIHPAGMKMFTTYALKKEIVVTPIAYTTYPFRSLGIFDIVSPDGLQDDLKYAMVKPLSDAATPQEQISSTLNKYPISISVTAYQADTSSLSAIVAYTIESDNYFAVQSGNGAYVTAERTLTLN